MALLWVRGDPHLAVVATFQHNHGDGAGVIFASWGSCARRLRPWWVSLHQFAEVAPPVGGCPAFPFRQAFVRRDVEEVGPWLWGSSFPAPGAWRGPGVCRWRYERVCPAQVRDPYASLVRLVDVEPPDPRVDKVVRDLQPRGDECLELPHGDVCRCGVRQGDHGEEPVRVDVLEVFPDGCHQPARGCVGVDVLDCPQSRLVKEVRVPPLWWSGRCGGAWSAGPGLVWCQPGRGALGWCQGVPQVRTPWRAPVAGTSDRTWRWAGSHWASQGQRPLSFLPAVQVEPPRRRPVPGVRSVALSAPPEAVEGMPRVPAAGFPQQDGRQGVWGLVMGQGGGAIRQYRQLQAIPQGERTTETPATTNLCPVFAIHQIRALAMGGQLLPSIRTETAAQAAHAVLVHDILSALRRALNHQEPKPGTCPHEHARRHH